MQTKLILHMELKVQIKASQDISISLPKLESFIKLIRRVTPDFESKRQGLEMLVIKVWLYGENVEIIGVIPADDGFIASTPSTL